MKSTTVFKICQSFLLAFCLFCGEQPIVAKPKPAIKLGAFYFDGWDGKNTFFITSKLANDFQERKPVWGWNTSTPEVMKKQIDLAADAGLSFFNFCWYDQKDGKYDTPIPMNNALHLYLEAANRNRIKFAIMVTNHTGYSIGPAQWNQLISYWCTLFKNPSYQKIDGKPFITFFSIQSLIKEFGSSATVDSAFAALRKKAVQEGLKGVVIAGNVNASPDLNEQARQCGFDIVTGYNYHGEGLRTSKDEVVPLDSMRSTERKVWDAIAKTSTLPVLPVITLNWDRRAWDKDDVTRSPRFRDYSGESVKKSIQGCKAWLRQNTSETCAEQVALVYAWNEYGEGAWLTPSKSLKNSLLNGVRNGLTK